MKKSCLKQKTSNTAKMQYLPPNQHFLRRAPPLVAFGMQKCPSPPNFIIFLSKKHHILWNRKILQKYCISIWRNNFLYGNSFWVYKGPKDTYSNKFSLNSKKNWVIQSWYGFFNIILQICSNKKNLVSQSVKVILKWPLPPL